MPEIETPPEILPEAVAKRRLLIYTLLRLAGLAALGVGVLAFGGGLVVAGGKIVGGLLVVIGAASLFIRPRLLGRVLGTRW
jgi:hypothetical protein